VTTNDTAIRLTDAVVALGGYPALAGATISVKSGELVALRGANGTGKSTLLRLCAGLVPLARGAANVLGVDLAADRSAVRSAVGLLGHKNGLYADLTARENVEFTSRLIGASTDDVDDALSRLAIDDRVAATRARHLSAGQRRRTALASLVVRRARLWLLDEPHAGLDATGRDVIDGLIGEAAAAGATVLFASHELDRAEAVAHRTVTVSGGAVLAEGASR